MQGFRIISARRRPAHTLATLLIKHLIVVFQSYSVVPLKLNVFPMVTAKTLRRLPSLLLKALFTRSVRIATMLDDVELVKRLNFLAL